MSSKVYNIGLEGSALATLLRVSRLLWAAPVRFQPRGVSFSRLLCLLGKVFVPILSVLAACQGYLNVSLAERGLRAIPLVLWSVTKAADILVNVFATYNMSKRMHSYLKSLERLQKINIELKDDVITKKEKYAAIVVKFNIILYLIIHTTIFCLKIYISIHKYRTIFATEIVAVSILAFVIHLAPFFYMIQFILLALTVMFSLQKVNKHLDRLLQGNINRFDPCIENLHWKIYYLAFSYSSMCDIVRESVENNESLLAFNMCRNIAFTEWVFENRDYAITKSDGFAITLTRVCRLMEAVTSMFNVISLAEISHRVKQQNAQTNRILRNLTLRTHFSVKVMKELKNFRRLLQLDDPSYVPMGIWTLNRSLIVTIIGSIISHLSLMSQL